MFLMFAAGFAVVAWRDRDEDPTRVTYADVRRRPDALIGLCAASTSTRTSWSGSSNRAARPTTGARLRSGRTQTGFGRCNATLNIAHQAGPLWQPHAAMSDWKPDGVAPLRLLSCSTSCCRMTLYDRLSDPRDRVRPASSCDRAVRARPFADRRSLAFASSRSRRPSRPQPQPRASAPLSRFRSRHPGRFHPVRPDADRRCASSITRRCKSRSPARPRSSRYKLIFTGFKFGTGLAGLGLHMQHEAVSPREPVPAADGLRAAVAAFREQPRARRDAGIPAGRLAGRPGAARQSCSCCPAFLDNIAAALIGGAMARHVFKGKVHIGYLARHRRRIECRRSRQRGRRHHHHDDVDRRHQPADGGRSVRRRGRRVLRVRHTRRDPAAPLLADPEGRAAWLADRLALARDRRADPRRRDRRERHRQPEIPASSTSCR